MFCNLNIGLKNFLFNIIVFLLAYVALITLLYYITKEFLSVNIPLLALILILFPNIYKLCYQIKNSYKNYIYEFIFSLIFSLQIIVGEAIFYTHKVQTIFHHPAKSLVLLIGGVVLWMFFFSSISNFYKKVSSKSENDMKTNINLKLLIPILYILLIVVYLIVYFAFYPGTFSYDVIPQTFQAIYLDELSNKHSIVHTLLWRFFINTGKNIHIEPLVLYSISQILFVTGCSTYLIYKMIKSNIPKFAWISSYLYFLLVPTLQMFSFVMTKDVIFSCFVLLFILKIKDIQINPSISNIIKLLIYGYFSVIFRGNMFFVILIMLFYSFILKSNKYIKMTFASIILFYILYTQIILPIWNIKMPPTKELLPIPLQQISYTYNNSNNILSESEKEKILTYIPKVTSYTPRWADSVKDTFNENLYLEKPSDFWNLYWEIFKKKPINYLNAFLDSNVFSFYLFQESSIMTDLNPYMEMYIIDVSFYELKRESKIPNLYDFYEKIGWFQSDFMKMPILYQYFILSFPLFTLLICSFIIIKFKRKDMYMPLGILVFLFLLYLFGPIIFYRYMYTFYLTMPFYIGYTFYYSNINKKVEK